jgi:hypothetical protein
MERSIAEIRVERDKIIASRLHKHVHRTYTYEEYKSDHTVVQNRDDICGFTILGDNGKPRMTGSWCRDWIVDETWFDDVSVLLNALDAALDYED